MKEDPMTVAQLARLFDRSPRQVRYAIRMVDAQPRSMIKPLRYLPADLVPALGPPPASSTT